MPSHMRQLMPRSRLLFCYAILTLLVGGSLFDIVLFREHWPLSPYWMFCTNVQADLSVAQYRAMAVPADGAAPFFLERPAQMQPWLPQRFSLALESLANRPHFSQIATDAARDMMKRYEVSRTRGEHHGPRLKAVILHRLTWRIREDVANKRTPETVAEIARFEAGEI